MVTSPRERRLTALIGMLAVLQRLYVFDAASARVAGAEPDPTRRAVLEGWMETVGKSFGAMIHGQDLDEDVLDALRPLLPWLKDELDLHYLLHDSSASLREQAAFGAAHVYSSDNRIKAEHACAQALGRTEQADWLLQQVQRSMGLVQQANAAVESSALGEPSDEAARFISSHVQAAVGEESRLKGEIDAVPTLLEGREPLG
ncbi:lysine--tRNAligase [Microbacterium sp. HM58-2]|nr:lysine--tRNAligase [Microbacterium sp. HM58-2]